MREIDKKIASYKAQDINKSKYKDNNITQEETIEKLVISKLKCYYCVQKVVLFYKKGVDICFPKKCISFGKSKTID